MVLQREKKKLTKYIPERQDIVWLDFDSSAGEEIKKRSPALVVSSFEYNKLTSLILVCPITHAQKNHLQKTGLLISLTNNEYVDGFVNPLQLHTYDFYVRDAKKIGELDDETFFAVLRVVRDIIE